MTETLTVGIVLKPQGIRGELKIKPYTDSSSDFKSFGRILIDGTEYRVLSVRISPDAVYLGLRGVPDRNAAELLRGKEVCVLRADAPSLPEGRYYIADLIGCEIFTETGEELGTLTEIRQGATDIYTLKQGEKEILFPAADGVVLEVDAEGGRITVSKARFLEVAVL